MKARLWSGAIAILVIAALVRMPALDADPPPGFQFHFVTDEGQYAHNARQKAATDEWVRDEHNAALYTAPLHTLLLERSYAWFGASLWSTRLPGAVAGVITSVGLFMLLYARIGGAAAAMAGLLCALSVFLVTNARVAFTESLQLAGTTLAVLAMWRARSQPGWAVLAALGLIAALAAKLSSLPVVLVLAAQWVWWARNARGRSAAPGFLRGAVLFFGTLAVIGAAIGIGWVLPHAAALRVELGAMGRLAVATIAELPPLDRWLWLGYRDDPIGVRVLGGLFAQEPALVLAAGWLGVATLLGRRVPGDRFLVASCWMWILLMLAAIGTHPSLSPDRRYVLLVPPLMILLSLAAFAKRRDSAPPSEPVAHWRVMGAWIAATCVLSLYLRPLAHVVLDRVVGSLPLGAEAGLSGRATLAAGWGASMGLAALLVGVHAFRRAFHPVAGVGRWLCAWALMAGTLQLGVHVIRPRFTLRDASRAIGTMIRSTSPERRIALGATAETFALENDLCAMVVRDWPYAGVRVNLNAVERTFPPYAIVTRVGERLLTGSEGFRFDDDPLLGAWPVWLDERGRPRFEVSLYERRPGTLPRPPAPSPSP